ncbi:MAG: CDP-alcohol phosphatidyltransferase family protein [Geminicoccaceae bacterium]
MLDARLRPLIDPPLDRLAARLAARGLRADTVTVMGFGIGLLAMAAIARGLYGLGLALILLNRAMDGLDGALARRLGPTDLGGFLDIVCDFIVYSGLVFAFALADPGRNALPAAFLILAFVGTGSSFLAFAIMAAKRGLSTERRGKKSLYYLGGLTEGTETIAMLVLACLFPELFLALAVVFGVLCWLTTGARVASAYGALRHTND